LLVKEKIYQISIWYQIAETAKGRHFTVSSQISPLLINSLQITYDQGQTVKFHHQSL